VEIYKDLLENYQVCFNLDNLIDVIEKRSDGYFYMYNLEESSLDTKIKEQLKRIPKEIRTDSPLLTTQKHRTRQRTGDQRSNQLHRGASEITVRHSHHEEKSFVTRLSGSPKKPLSKSIPGNLSHTESANLNQSDPNSNSLTGSSPGLPRIDSKTDIKDIPTDNVKDEE